MHPFLHDRTTRTWFLAAWGVVGLLLTALLAAAGSMGWSAALVLALPAGVVYGFMCLSARYLCAAYPLDTTPWMLLLGVHLLAGTVAASLWLLLVSAWSILLTLADLPGLTPAPGTEELRLLFGVGVALFWLAAAAHYLLHAFETRRAAERRALELELHAREAELHALRSQVHPHVLFNSLNSVHALIPADPEAARRMLLRLADLLRRTLSLGGARQITLGEELAIAMDYLELEQTRFGDRLRIEPDVPDALRGFPVPPFCLLPLAENAVTHGIARMVEGGTLRIAATVQGDTLRLEVENPVDPDGGAGRGAGTGLRNLRNRLRAIYGPGAGLEATGGRDRFRVLVTIPREAAS
jgi:sensor histidine kinase YesM